MRSDILEKLQVELNKPIEGEPQVVYILSRVRKIIEIEKDAEKFAVLKFYCNWAMHTEITYGTKPVEDVLNEIIKETVAADNRLMFEMFHEEFQTFLKEHEISSILCGKKENEENFEKYLLSIYSDTPLSVNGKYKISFSDAGNLKVEKI